MFWIVHNELKDAYLQISENERVSCFQNEPKEKKMVSTMAYFQTSTNFPGKPQENNHPIQVQYQNERQHLR